MGIKNEELLGIVVAAATIVMFGCVILFPAVWNLLRSKSRKVQDNYDSKGPCEDDTSQSRRQSRLNRYAMSSVEEDEGSTEHVTKMAWRSSNLYRQIKRFSKIPLTGHGSSPEVAAPTDNVPMNPKESAPATHHVPMSPKENAPATDNVPMSPKESAPATHHVPTSPKESAPATHHVPMSPKESAPATDHVPVSPKESAPATDQVAMSPKETAPATDHVPMSSKENAPADGLPIEESRTLSSNNTSLEKGTCDEVERSE